MRLSSKTIKPFLGNGIIHFIGVGGIGMSGICEILHNLGYNVQGSDSANNSNVQRLKSLGIKVIVGQKEENVEDAEVIVKSSAIKDTNPEIIAGRERRIPIIQRAEMLAEIMRLKLSVAVAGTHGKTTTTSMVTSMFDAANLDPTVINGGIINRYGTNAHLGDGDWLIAEADESDGTFLKLPATVGIITNIDPEHMEHYGTFDVLKKSFRNFIENLPFYGFGVLCKDHPEVSALATTIKDRKVITYGIETQADVRAENIRIEKGGSTYDVEISDKLKGGSRKIKNIHLPMPGQHNVLNSLAAISVAAELEFDNKTILNGFSKFQGIKRRFTKTGEYNGITIIDDYGHHPKEIAVTLKTAQDTVKDTKGNVIAVVQPHRYSRVKDLFSDFCSCFAFADEVIVSDIYEAGETPIEGINRDSLVDGIRKSGHKNVVALESKDELPQIIKRDAKSGDVVVCLGAGSISLWANELPGQLKELKPESNGAAISA
ncbi:MAG: UDP-N-acetylmuramate--L-alanine ligase [Rickettsiales bacterium]|nr:UDP-N-acetylmuramate--L-alanine ligase [Pseudomonadota bacterium]MDA0965949.1 UDP-N-acetylmuramate--L-alanine ligase [Pseudomonadota bacterium]MDG4542579.1 UDP-N-acetylmuramate--L-alanine ligase [Rickettsiales bacterium]MDG4545083.1 UDP-N-acetylmuramate--L-alanine ligase [Rickettsiales bacterium]MDG4547206.1 UDP-N-acetylmuramate--L-alanine ligase [Rickettsiales bacterium]